MKVALLVAVLLLAGCKGNMMRELENDVREHCVEAGYAYDRAQHWGHWNKIYRCRGDRIIILPEST